MTTLIIARHGNTFEAGEPPRRVGARTDLPLTEKGREQARAIGRYLKENGLVPDVTYSSALIRTKETAEIAVREAGYPQHVYALDIFNEIDYGPDENKTEDEVIARLGAQALKDWDESAIVPEGWNVEPGEIIHNWQGFADQVLRDAVHYPHTIPPHPTAAKAQAPNPSYPSPPRGEARWGGEGTTDDVALVVTSNGIARFAPYITENFKAFRCNHTIKISTGALCVFRYKDGQWAVEDWNIKPS